MKVSNSVVSAIVVAAVLVFAYGLGLLIRQARMGGVHRLLPAEVNSVGTVPRTGPRATGTKNTPEARMRLKEQKAKALEKMSSLTKEEKEEFRRQIVKQVGGRRESEEISNLPQERQRALKAKVRDASSAAVPKLDANAPAEQGDDASTKPGNDNVGSEPGRAGPG